MPGEYSETDGGKDGLAGFHKWKMPPSRRSNLSPLPLPSLTHSLCCRSRDGEMIFRRSDVAQNAVSRHPSFSMAAANPIHVHSMLDLPFASPFYSGINEEGVHVTQAG